MLFDKKLILVSFYGDDDVYDQNLFLSILLIILHRN
jgi:hypothetical protein